jgi:hypothetical protein
MKVVPHTAAVTKAVTWARMFVLRCMAQKYKKTVKQKNFPHDLLTGEAF